MSEVSVDEFIQAPPQKLYDLVTDVTRMGEWSPETTGCRWLVGATGPRVGARFRGANRLGRRRWSTTCTVVEADPGNKFSFEVTYARLPVARWSYHFAPEGEGCRVTESWVDRRPPWMDRLGAVVVGVPDRAAHNRKGMEATLGRLRKFAE